MSAVLEEINPVPDSLWEIRPAENKWSIAEIVEHLILQDQAYYREIKVVSNLPHMPQYVNVVKGNDEKFLEYESDPSKSTADWDVTPIGRFCSKSDAIELFMKTRQKMIEYVGSSGTDFRQVFTFRKIPAEVKTKNPEFYRIREVRDLHQLILNAIAHTGRHKKQIIRTKDAIN